MSKEGLAPSTSGKHVKRVKTMFQSAVRDRLFDENPAADQKVRAEINRSRDFFVTPEMFAAVIEECRNDDWRLIFALTRIGGLRGPSEVLTLKWSDIDWERGIMRIDSPKTGLRFCPIFPELQPFLSEAQKNQGGDSPYCVKGYRYVPFKSTNLNTQATRIIEKAGIKPWPKIFVNQRASRRTELEEDTPNHVINA